MLPTSRDTGSYKLGTKGGRRQKKGMFSWRHSMIFPLVFLLFLPSVALSADYTVSMSADIAIPESSDATFTITINPALVAGDSVTVDYITADGTATSGDGDFTYTDSSITFSTAGQSSQDITITVNDDAVVEDAETFQVRIDGCTNTGGLCTPAEPPPITRTVTVNDNDEYTISVSNAAAVTEGSNSSFTVTVSPTVQAGDTVTVDYSTLDTGTAKSSDGDFTAVSNQTISFAAGESSKPATVTILDDAEVEGQETFPVQLSNPTTTTGTAAIGTGSATGTINSNDSYSITIADAGDVSEGGTATFKVTVSPAVIAGDTVTVDYTTMSGTAVAPDDYTAKTNTLTFGPGETTQNITVTTIDDTDVDLE
ncbi:MAG: hypothetical protein JRJ31_19650 [Deltaproteobacteria bacterium]|nr:hypothetical protein [Deltaproteobacteria bacterium]